jgi:FlaA1/EpsC-like NDP-sugar epimerase
VIVIYYVLMPFLQCPGWCAKAQKENNKTQALFYSCKEFTNNTIPYSNCPKLAPYAAGIIDILCLGFLAFTATYKTFWRTTSKKDRIRIPLLAFLFVTCLIDVIYSMVEISFPFYTSFMKPVVVLMFLNTIRANLKIVLYDLKDSSIVLLIIFSFIFFFAFSGFFLF